MYKILKIYSRTIFLISKLEVKIQRYHGVLSDFWTWFISTELYFKFKIKIQW